MVDDIISELAKERKEHNKKDKQVIRYCYKILGLHGEKVPSKPSKRAEDISND